MNGPFTQAGTLTPQHSGYGQAMAAITGMLIAQPRPIGTQDTGYGGNIGAIMTRSANVTGLASDEGYFGDLPQSEQPSVAVPDPWNRV